MVIGILLGQLGREDFPDRDVFPVLGRPLGEYAMMALERAPSLERRILSTDAPKLKSLAVSRKFEVVERPNFLFGEKVYAFEVFADTYEIVQGDRPAHKDDIVVLSLCNSPLITPEMVEEAVAVLRRDEGIDSVVSVSANSFYGLERAFVLDDLGHLQPFPAPSPAPRLWYPNSGLVVTRGHRLRAFSRSAWPHAWLGPKVHPLKQWGAKDVDFESDIPLVEWSLRRMGFNDRDTPYRT